MFSSALKRALTRQWAFVCSRHYLKKSEPLWIQTLNNAEKVVGYPISFFGLRFLLNDEIANIANILRKLVGSNHPLLDTARCFIYDSKQHLHIRGTIVLLFSKAADSQANEPSIYTDGQRTLAEITEVIHTAFIVHHGLLNDSEIMKNNLEANKLDNLYIGNRLSVLIGDYLLSAACSGLARLRIPEIVDIMSASISQTVEASFLSSDDTLTAVRSAILSMPPTTASSQPLPPVDFVSDNRVKLKMAYNSCVLAASCRCAMILANHREYENLAVDFATNLTTLLQLCDLASSLRSLRQPLSELSRHDTVVASALELLHARAYSSSQMAIACLQKLPDNMARSVLIQLCQNLISDIKQ